MGLKKLLCLTIRERLTRENMQLLGIWFFIAVAFLVCFEPFLCTFERLVRSSICCCFPMLLLMRSIRSSISLGRLDLRIQETCNQLLVNAFSISPKTAQKEKAGTFHR